MSRTWSCGTLAEGIGQVMADALDNEEQALCSSIEDQFLPKKSNKYVWQTEFRMLINLKM